MEIWARPTHFSRPYTKDPHLYARFVLRLLIAHMCSEYLICISPTSNLVRDGSVNMGTKFAHSDKSVKLGRHVHWTLLFGKTNGSTLGNKCFR